MQYNRLLWFCVDYLHLCLYCIMKNIWNNLKLLIASFLQKTSQIYNSNTYIHNKKEVFHCLNQSISIFWAQLKHQMIQKIADFVDIVGYRSVSTDAKKTFWGTLLIKLGSGLISVQATVIIYYFSFFHQVRNAYSSWAWRTIELLQSIMLLELHG